MSLFEKTIHKEYISIEFVKLHIVHDEADHKSYFSIHRFTWTVLYMSTCFFSVNRYNGVYIATNNLR